MFHALKSHFARLLGRYTYRQRFLFLGILFFLFGLVPVYLTVKALRYAIQDQEQQLLSLAYQREMENLLNTLESDPKAVAEHLAALAKLQDLAAEKSGASLGPGFSTRTSWPEDSERWQRAWQSQDLNELKLLVQIPLQRLQEQLTGLTEEQIRSQKARDVQMLWILYTALFLGALVVLFYLVKKLLTNHLQHLTDHIEQMASGRLTPCFCSGDKDEFGRVGRALDLMSATISHIAQEMHALGDKLAAASQQIAQTTHEQEYYIHGQEMQIQTIETTAQELAQTQRNLALKTQQEDGSGKRSVFSAEKVQTDMEQLQTHIHTLLQASASIVTLLSGVEDKVQHSAAMIAFMTKVSESANLLALNASIETANLTKNRESFAAISQKIQRFAENTAASSIDIKSVVLVMLENVSAVKADSLACLKEINAGGQQLMDVSRQLAHISQQSREQIEKFDELTHFIQRQAVNMDQINQDIVQLRTSSQTNKALIQGLHNALINLSDTATHLQQTLCALTQPDTAHG